MGQRVSGEGRYLHDVGKMDNEKETVFTVRCSYFNGGKG